MSVYSKLNSYLKIDKNSKGVSVIATDTPYSYL